VKFGRRPKLTTHQQQEALARRAAGEAYRPLKKPNQVCDPHAR
jgi:hypothetical protein